MYENGQDDGSLAFLKIAPDPNNKHFNCDETTQQKLVNTAFWVFDFMEVSTKFGEGRYLVKIKPERDAPENQAQKFFTNSREIKWVLDRIRERNAFPRRVTLRATGTRYYFE